MSAQAMPHHTFDIPTTCAREVDHVKRLLWQQSHVPPENYTNWICPCCDQVKLVYAPDGEGRVWIALVESTNNASLDIVRIDTIKEARELPELWPHPGDRFLIAAWYAAGLGLILIGMFAS